MCSRLKRLPYGFADGAGAECKKGGGGKAGRVALGPRRAFLSRRWEFSLLQGSRSPSPASELLRSPQEEPGSSPPEPRTRLGPPAPPGAMDRLPQLVLWVTAAGKELTFLPPSSFGANSLLCPGTQTSFVAPSLLPLKAVKHSFQSSGGERRGEKGLAWNVHKVRDVWEDKSWWLLILSKCCSLEWIGDL